MAEQALEEAWLDWCAGVIRDRSHDGTCRLANQRSHDDIVVEPPCLEVGGWPGLRWPGYLGESYERGGVLCIANVHRELTSDGVRRDVVADLVAASTGLAQKPTSEEVRAGYLKSSRAVYETGLARWNVGRPFMYILRGAGITLKQIAYTNGAKCQQPTGQAYDANRVAKRCVRDFDPVTLIELLDPALVLTCSAPVAKHLGDLDGLVHAFPQRWSYARLDELVSVARARLR